MLKRPRAPSPSPTRPDPSSPPPLDSNAHLPITKRRRIAGPVIDSTQRRDLGAVDDGEDDYEDDDEASGTSVDVSQGKVYEHVNHFLHHLHTEYQHRSRAQPQHSSEPSHFAHPVSQHAYVPAAFSSHRNSSSVPSSPISSPAKHARDPLAYPSSVLSAQHRELESQDTEDGEPCGLDRSQYVEVGGVPNTQQKGVKSDVLDNERCRVMHRYEETNRLLGSLVLSRRRTLGSPSTEPDDN